MRGFIPFVVAVVIIAVLFVLLAIQATTASTASARADYYHSLYTHSQSKLASTTRAASACKSLAGKLATIDQARAENEQKFAQDVSDLASGTIDEYTFESDLTTLTSQLQSIQAQEQALDVDSCTDGSGAGA